MDYVSLLTKEEKKALCEIITGKEFVKLFQRHSEEFLKMRNGFRVESLRDTIALVTAKANVDTPFISMHINKRMEVCLSEMSRQTKAFEEKGLHHSIALAMILIDFGFAENLDLYFKLTQNVLENDARITILAAIEGIQAERAQSVKNIDAIQQEKESALTAARAKIAELGNQVNRLEHNNQLLSSEIQTLHQKADSSNAEWEEIVKKLESYKKDAEAEQFQAHAKINDLQAQLSSARSEYKELQESGKTLLRAEWEATNENLLAKAQEKLDALNYEVKVAAGRLVKVQNELNKNIAEKDHLEAVIAEKEKLAKDVEAAVDQRIQTARQNAADFIAGMAFVGGQSVHIAAKESSAVAEAMLSSSVDSYRVFSAVESAEDFETHHSWMSAIDAASLELMSAGVAEKHSYGLAAFLCAAYIEKQPILLAGPNAMDIVQAFSAAIAGGKYGAFYCDGYYNEQAIKKMGGEGECVVLIRNLFASNRINHLPEILSKKDIFYIAVHPYSEDVQVEPKSLYGFMLPLFTEFFVDKPAEGKYYGGYLDAGLADYTAPKSAGKDLRVLPKFPLSPLVRNRIRKLTSTMRSIYPAIKEDDEFLLTILPIAHALQATDKLSEILADSQQGISISPELKRDLRYVLGDIG